MKKNKEDRVNSIIRKNLIRLRRERGWNQVQMAEHYGCTWQFISQLETGHRGIGKDTFSKLLQVFGVDEGELLKISETDDRGPGGQIAVGL